MILSDSLPIQFWPTGTNTFNEDSICGIVKQDCFCQPIECDDQIVIGVSDTAGLIFFLVGLDSSGSELFREPFSESSGDYSISIIPNDYSVCDEQIRLTIDEVSLGAWTTRTSPGHLQYYSIAYGNGYYVAVTYDGGTGAAKRSADGITWFTQVTPNRNWVRVIWDGTQFVAMNNLSTYQMTSPDGQTWTETAISTGVNCDDLAYGNGIYVIAYSGIGAEQISISYDLITWYPQFPAVTAATWSGIAYGNGLFVVVASNGSGHGGVMTSTDGVTWTERTQAEDNSWASVCFGNDLFVAVASSGTHRVMTSPDGITWTARSGADSIAWTKVCYGNGLYVAVAATGTTNRAMYSADGITWTMAAVPFDNSWRSVVYGNNRFVACSTDYTSGFDEIMSMDISNNTLATSDCLDVRTTQECTKLISYTNSADFDGLSYGTLSPDPVYYLRIPAIFFEEKNPQEQEDMELSNGQIVTIRQTIQEKRLLDTGFMPNYMHRKLQKVLMHEMVTIDGDTWKKRDSYDDQPIKKYNLKRASVWLTKYDSVEKNTI